MRSRPVSTSLGRQMSTSMPRFTLSATHASRRSEATASHHRHSEPVPGEDVVHPPCDVPGACVRGVYQHPPSLHPLGGHRVDERALLRVELLLRRPKSSLTVAATNIGDVSKPPDPFNVRLVNVRLNGRLLQFPRPAMEAARPGSRSRSTDVFVGGSGPARTAPPVKPSAQPFPPPLRSTDGAHINPGGPRGCGQPLHQCQTHGDAYEATRSGRARPGGSGPHDPRTSRPGYSPGLTFGYHTRRYDSWLTWKRK